MTDEPSPPPGSATRRGVLLGATLAAAAPVAGANAQTPAPPGFAAAITRANSGTVGVISGAIDGTYVRIAADLAAVLDDPDRLRVLPIIGKGSVQNLSDIIYLRGIDLGIVQSDALAYVTRERMFPGVTEAIRYVTKLYDEEVHILARPEITKLGDLEGKPVNLDVLGSGTAMTGSLIFSTLNVAIQPVHNDQDVALQRLRAGEIAALVYVAGKPARLFSGITGDPGGLHFVPIPPEASLLETYLPSSLENDAYPALIPAGKPVETLAVGAVMAAYAWQPGTERYGKVVRFIGALTAKFPLLQRPPRHPKWREVNLGAQVPGWTRFAAAPPTPPPDRPGLRFRSYR